MPSCLLRFAAATNGGRSSLGAALAGASASTIVPPANPAAATKFLLATDASRPSTFFRPAKRETTVISPSIRGVVRDASRGCVDRNRARRGAGHLPLL